MIRIDHETGRGRWAVFVGCGVLVRCRTRTDARRLWGQNEPRNPYVVRRVLWWRRGKEWVREATQ